MSMSIVTNVNSMVAQENLRVNNEFQSRTIQRLTSGYRINASADDAAGLAVANGLRGSIAELTQGVRNANDGMSQLQIIDGGLNNIAKILDRMKTLATQSASDSFTGDRTLLNNEFVALRAEVTRQATNIKLNTGGGYLTTLSVYTGGGIGALTNSTVQVNLGSTAVDATGLALGTLSIAGGTSAQMAYVDPTSAATLGTSGILQASTQTLRVATALGNTTITLSGGANGLTQNELLTQLNQQLSGTGVSASIVANKVRFSSGNGFLVNVADATNSSAGIGAAEVATNGFIHAERTATALGAGDDQNIIFKLTGTTTAISVALAANDSIDAQEAKLRAGLANTGIELARDGTTFSFQSKVAFTLETDGAAGHEALGLISALPLAGGGAYNGAAGTVTANATTALTAISAAVTTLGTVQGRVGLGQNTLQYAIQLAQSQISSFSAAESRIRDADVAAEAANLTKAQVMQQASLAAMAQANSAPQAILALLRG